MTRKRKSGRLAVGGVLVLLIAMGCTDAPASRPDSETRPGATAAATDVSPRSSDVLASLPDGPEKRKLLLDCTACHQLGIDELFPDGALRTEDEWVEIVARMRQVGGTETETPLISPERDPAATAAWLVANLTEPPAGRRPIPTPPGAEITPFTYPHAEDLPHDVVLEPDGHVLVTGMFTHRMLRLDPADGSWTEIEIPVETANPRAIEVDEAGDWWVLLGVPEQIARYRVADDEWDTWDIGMYGHSLRLDGRGRVWFNGHFTRHPSVVGWLDVASGEVTTVDIPDVPVPEADHPMPYGLRVDPDGRVWGTELRGGRLFAVDPAGGAPEVWTIPEAHSGPRRPAVDASGRIWVPEYAANRLTRFDPNTREFRSFDFPIPDVLPYVVEVDQRTGQVWVGTSAGDVIFRFDPGSEQFTAYPMPTDGALIRHLVVDRNTGEVWAAYGAFPGVPPLIIRIRAGHG